MSDVLTWVTWAGDARVMCQCDGVTAWVKWAVEQHGWRGWCTNVISISIIGGSQNGVLDSIVGSALFLTYISQEMNIVQSQTKNSGFRSYKI